MREGQGRGAPSECWRNAGCARDVHLTGLKQHQLELWGEGNEQSWGVCDPEAPDRGGGLRAWEGRVPGEDTAHAKAQR